VFNDTMTRSNIKSTLAALAFISGALCGCAGVDDSSPATNVSGPATNVWVTVRWEDTMGNTADAASSLVFLDRDRDKVYITDGILQEAAAHRSDTISDLDAIGFELGLGVQEKCARKNTSTPSVAGGFVGNYSLCVKFLGMKDNAYYFDSTTRSSGPFSRGREVMIQHTFGVTFGIPCRVRLLSAQIAYPNYPGVIATMTKVREQSCLNLRGR
jgi:hypothetical protein